jgi:hypothetical protein
VPKKRSLSSQQVPPALVGQPAGQPPARALLLALALLELVVPREHHLAAQTCTLLSCVRMRLDRCALCGACPAASASKCMQLGFLRHIAAPRGGAPPRSRRNRATHRATSNGADRSEHKRMHLRTPLAVLWSSWPLHRSRPRHLTMPPAPGGSHLCRFPPSRFRAACPFGRYCAPCLRVCSVSSIPAYNGPVYLVYDTRYSHENEKQGKIFDQTENAALQAHGGVCQATA